MKIKNYRNIGICAHIDAGKTSVTERILYITGITHKIGEVFNGEATMDWMDQEKERGITINSASTTIFWRNIKKYKINIIDTPGHIDFTAEVERSLRVLDGICLVICGTAGIQAQTEKIWELIKKQKIPCIIFINKMDRKGSNFIKVKNRIEEIFKIKTAIINMPYIKNNELCGIIDIIKEEIIKFKGKNGINLEFKKIIGEEVKTKKRELIEESIEDNDKYIEKYISGKLLEHNIIKSIREKTIKRKIFPIVCGSAIKNIGIQQLLNAITNYLPYPNYKKKLYVIENNKKKNIINEKIKFLGLIFKTTFDILSGITAFIRIYKGNIKVGETIYNSSKKTEEKISRIIRIHANKKKTINIGKEGDIIAVNGLKNPTTGDTLCYPKKNILLEKIKFSEPVINISIRAQEKNKQENLIEAIKKINIEDQTIITKFKKEEIIIYGMGELHIEVFLEKIKRLFKINIIQKEPKVLYKETIKNEIKNVEGKYIKQTGGRGQYGHVVINVKPRKNGKGIKIKNLITKGSIPKEYIKPIKESMIQLCQKGINKNIPVTDIKIEIIGGSYHEVDSNENSFKNASIIAIKKAVLDAEPTILEPIMKIEIKTPTEFMGQIQKDIIKKKGTIINTKEIKEKETKIKCIIPLSMMFRYTTTIRSKSKGKATFTMEPFSYKKVNKGNIIKL